MSFNAQRLQSRPSLNSVVAYDTDMINNDNDGEDDLDANDAFDNLLALFCFGLVNSQQ